MPVTEAFAATGASEKSTPTDYEPTTSSARTRLQNKKKVNTIIMSDDFASTDIKPDRLPHEEHQSGKSINPRETKAQHAPKQKRQDSHQNQGNPQAGLSCVQTKSIEKPKRQRWTKEQYKEVMWSFYYVKASNTEKITEGTYNVWRTRNPDIFPGMNAITLGNQRRFIEKENKLTAFEIETIKENVNHIISNKQNHDNKVKQPDAASHPTPFATKEMEQQKNDEDTNDMEIAIITKLIEIKGCKMENRKSLNKIKNINQISDKLEKANKALTKLTSSNNLNLTEINELIYATAAVLAKEKQESNCTSHESKKQNWKARIQRSIETCRKDLAILREFKKLNASKKVQNAANHIFKKNNHTLNQSDELENKISMKLQAKSQRLRRYTKRSEHYHQNKLFNDDAKKFYRKLNNQTIQIKEPPGQDSIEQFWRGILENEVSHHKQAKWIKDAEISLDNVPSTSWCDLTLEETQHAIKKSHNWKAPGPDKIQNFWLKHLPSIHQPLTLAFNEILKNPVTTPQWLTSGITYLLPKDKDTASPKNYRPITCLPTIYKILTSTISNRIYDHLEKNNIMPEEQKGCRKGSRGCKDQLLISKMVMEHAKQHKRNLCISWIDYRKAFDSVPHSWITQVLQIYKVCDTITDFIKHSMLNWRTEMLLTHESGCLKTNKISIKRGIFQGDSLSPLLFCLALMPLSNILKQSNNGYMINKNNKISHLLYMDDLKLFAASSYKMQQDISLVESFTKDIGMEFGLDKCATLEMKGGKLVKCEGIKLQNETEIRSLECHETYKYLGVNESNGINNLQMKEKVKQEYFRRLRKILGTQLSSRNKVMAINSLAIPVMTYSFGVLDWLRSEILQLDRKTRKKLTLGGIHHPKADADRLYVKRKNGGRGLLELEAVYDQTMVGLADYLESEYCCLMKIVKANDHNKNKHSLKKHADEVKETLLIANTISGKDLAKELKGKIEKGKIEKIKAKPLHGQFFRNLDKPGIDVEDTMMWLKNAGLKGETESLIIAAQDQALNTRYHQKNILKIPVDSSCRMCHRNEEHVSHLVSGCTTLAPTEYLKRHNKVASYIHWTVCRTFAIPVVEKYFMHEPASIINTDTVTIMWDSPVITDRTIMANRPDLVIHNKKEKTCLLIDVSVPNDTNVMMKEAEKILKYKDLEIEISRMWNAKTRTIPIIIGALGTLRKDHARNTEMIPGKPKMSEMQKISLMGTAHILRKVLG